MATLLQQSENLKKLNESVIERQIFKALKEAEAAIIKANKEQLDKGDDSDGNQVGVYAKDTQGYADYDNVDERKTINTPYNFEWFGTFYRGFTLSVSGTTATISSTGIGSGGKREFLTKNNLFGLNEDNLRVIVQRDIIPFVNRFARRTLKI